MTTTTTTTTTTTNTPRSLRSSGGILSFRLAVLILFACGTGSNEVRALNLGVGGGENARPRNSSGRSGNYDGGGGIRVFGIPSAAGTTADAPSSSSRRGWFVRVAARTTTAATAAAGSFSVITAAPSIAAAAGGPSADAARDQWKAGLTILRDLKSGWSEIATSGDAIRTKLGTQGTVSPLFQIDKAFRSLRDSSFVDDFIEFQETSEEFGLALSRADAMAYSANFAGGSGKPTPPAVYIEKSRIEVSDLLRIAEKLDAMIK